MFNYEYQSSLDNKASITFEIRKSSPSNLKNKNTINNKNNVNTNNSLYETIKHEIEEIANDKNQVINLKQVTTTNPKIKNYNNSGLFSRDLRWNSRQLNSLSLNFNNNNSNKTYEIANKPEKKLKTTIKEKANNQANCDKYTNIPLKNSNNVKANKISVYKTNTNYKNIYLSQAKIANK